MTTRAFLIIFLVLLIGLFSFFAISLQKDEVSPVKNQEGKPLILDRDLYTIENTKVDKELLLKGK